MDRETGMGGAGHARHRLSCGTYHTCSACVAGGDVYGHVIYVLPLLGTETGWVAGHAIYWSFGAYLACLTCVVSSDVYGHVIYYLSYTYCRRGGEQGVPYVDSFDAYHCSSCLCGGE